MAKQRAKSAREGENKPFGGAAADTAYDQLLRKAAASSAPPVLSNNMLDSIEGYINNIADAATQPVTNGDPLAELSAILAVSFCTSANQAEDIKRLHQQINALKKKGTPKSSS